MHLEILSDAFRSDEPDEDHAPHARDDESDDLLLRLDVQTFFPNVYPVNCRGFW